MITFLLFSCGDVFSPKEKIVGNYYLVEGDTKDDQSICYMSGKDYIIKIPSQVVEYGYSDSFLVARTKDRVNYISYYIIYRNKDFDVAKEENYRVGPLSEVQYNTFWREKLRIKFTLVK